MLLSATIIINNSQSREYKEHILICAACLVLKYPGIVSGSGTFILHIFEHILEGFFFHILKNCFTL